MIEFGTRWGDRPVSTHRITDDSIDRLASKVVER